MKRSICVLLCLCVLCLLSACSDGGTAARTGSRAADVGDVLAAGMANAATDAPTSAPTAVPVSTSAPQTAVPTSAPTAAPMIASAPQTAVPTSVMMAGPVIRPKGESGVDVDLTVLSSVLVYSEVYNMMASPQDYIGKTVKMSGLFDYFHDEASDKYYFACVIQDATACCSSGIEFCLTDEYSFPEDYPERGGEVCVTGVFDTYMEGEYTYCTLRNARLNKT